MDKPNILIIMADQLTPFMTGFYGNNQVKTPNLDKLCSESARFDNAYTPYPLCTPARAALMTGKYCYNLGCYDNATPFSSDEPTFAHYLTVNGYETVLSGKMHFIGPDQLHGFHRRFTTDIYPSGFNWNPSFIDKENHLMRGKGIAAGYVEAGMGPKEWNIGLQHDKETHFRALEYLYTKGGGGGAKKQRQPFCLCVSYHHPHDPFNPPQKYWDMYRDAPMDIPEINEAVLNSYTTLDKWLNNGFHRNDLDDITGEQNLLKLRRCYAALVTYVDDLVGELLDALEYAGMDKNTVIIFTTDHGDMLGERGMVQKRCFYEWSAKIPMLLKMPDGSLAGKQCAAPASLIDICPTLREITGESGVTGYPAVDGVSLLDVLGGKHEDRVIFSEGHGEGVVSPVFMAKSKKYKYMHFHQNQIENMLFDVESDPREKNNLNASPEYAGVASMLRESILARFSPEKVQAELDKKIPERQLILEAMRLSGTKWDYTPEFPGSGRYVRGK